MWQRSDGAILWMRSFLSLRLELPAARQYEEQLKAAKDQKAQTLRPKVLVYRRRISAAVVFRRFGHASRLFWRHFSFDACLCYLITDVARDY